MFTDNQYMKSNKKYFKLGDKVYCFKENAVIGRVAPFESIYDKHSISRVHCELIFKRNELYIKRLSKHSLVRINRKRLKFLKKSLVSSNDEIYLGDEKLELLDNYDGDDFIELEVYENVKRQMPIFVIYEYVYNLTTTQKKIFLTILLTLFLSFYQLESSSNFHYIGFIIAVFYHSFFSYLIVSWIIFITNFFKLFDLEANKVVLGEDDFTIFFDDSNMNVKFEEILNIKKKKFVIEIKTEDNQYFIPMKLKNSDSLYKKIISKTNITAEKSLGVDPRVILGISLYVIIKLFEKIPMEYLFYAHVIIWPLALFLVKTFYPFNSKKQKNYASKLIIAIFIFSIFVTYYENKEIKMLEQCISQKNEVCSKLDLKRLGNVYYDDEDKQKLALSSICEYDKELCKKAKTRFKVSKEILIKDYENCMKKEASACDKLDSKTLGYLFKRDQEKLKILQTRVCEMNHSLCNEINLSNQI